MERELNWEGGEKNIIKEETWILVDFLNFSVIPLRCPFCSVTSQLTFLVIWPMSLGPQLTTYMDEGSWAGSSHENPVQVFLIRSPKRKEAWLLKRLAQENLHILITVAPEEDKEQMFTNSVFGIPACLLGAGEWNIGKSCQVRSSKISPHSFQKILECLLRVGDRWVDTPESFERLFFQGELHGGLTNFVFHVDLSFVWM